MRDAAVLPGAPATPDAGAVAVGEIVGAHALRGWREASVSHAAAHGRGLLLVGLDGVSDRTAAEALRGARLLVRRDDLPALDEDEYYHHEMIGFTVETLDGEVVGVIAGTMTTGLHDVWEVRAGDREHLIPVVADVVRAIDRDGRRVRIDPLPGLLD